MGQFKVGTKVKWNNQVTTIVGRGNNRPTNKLIYHSGVYPVGFKGTPRKYILATGEYVNGKSLREQNPNYPFEKLD